MAENGERVRSIHPTLAQFSVERAARNPTQVPYHPGAERFYRDAPTYVMVEGSANICKMIIALDQLGYRKANR